MVGLVLDKMIFILKDGIDKYGRTITYHGLKNIMDKNLQVCREMVKI